MPQRHDPDFRLLFESALGSYLVLTPDLQIVAVSDAYLRTTRTVRTAIVDRHLFDVFPDTTPDPAATAARHVERSLERLRHTRAPEAMPVQRHAIRAAADGGAVDERFWSAVNSPVFDTNGDLAYIIHSVQDVTDVLRVHRALETELAQTHAELESFGYSVSHDLRAPLRAIDGFSHELLDHSAAVLDEEGRGYLARVRAAAKRMSALIDALLHLSRLSRRPLVVAERVDLSAMARAIAQDLERADPGRALHVRIDEGIIADGDASLMKVVLENLMQNAWKFTGPVPDPLVHVGWATTDGECRYFVRDNGVGFELEYAERLFAPFQRFHHEREFPGVGIGLAAAARIIRRHGGQIRAESAAGQGATFSWTFGPARP